MIRGYVPSQLEQWVCRWYKNMGVFHPHEIDQYAISEQEGVMLIEKPCTSHTFVDDEIKVICVNSNMNINERRAHFFHELAHVLRHEGSQTIINNGFRMVQEFDAETFAKYAMMPLHMIKRLNFCDPFITEKTSLLFSVPFKFAELRLQKIKENILSRANVRTFFRSDSMPD